MIAAYAGQVQIVAFLLDQVNKGEEGGYVC